MSSLCLILVVSRVMNPRYHQVMSLHTKSYLISLQESDTRFARGDNKRYICYRIKFVNVYQPN